MSDGITDANRDIDRTRAYSHYLDSLYTFLKYPTEDARKAVFATAKATDDVRDGHSGSTCILATLEKRLHELLIGDRQAWAQFLAHRIKDAESWMRFKEISPFAKGFLVVVDYYGSGCIKEICGDMEAHVNHIIRMGKGWKTDGDTFLVVMDPPGKSTDAFWVDTKTIGTPEHPRPRGPRLVEK